LGLPEVPIYTQSTSNKFVSPNGLYFYFPQIPGGIYKMIALIQLDPPTGYYPYSGDFEVIASLSYPSGGVLAKLVTTVGFVARGHTTVIGNTQGYTTVSFDLPIPLQMASGVVMVVYLPTWSQYSGKEVAYLIQVS